MFAKIVIKNLSASKSLNLKNNFLNKKSAKIKTSLYLQGQDLVTRKKTDLCDMSYFWLNEVSLYCLGSEPSGVLSPLAGAKG